MIRRPPRSTLFPYTSSSDLRAISGLPSIGLSVKGVENKILRLTHLRSEEHTSELQSLRHLVCRLLLEKKKKKVIRMYVACTSKSTQNTAVDCRPDLSCVRSG